MLGTGIYNYFAAVIPEEYPAVKPLIGFAPPGDKELGLLQLKAAAKYARYSAVEAKIVLLQIYYDFEKNYKTALPIAKELHKHYPNNPMIHRYYGRCLVTQWYLDDFERQWRKILIRYIDKQPGYDVKTAREALYYIGYALQSKRKYDIAVKYLKKCDEASKKIDDEPSGFRILANLKIAQIYFLQKKNKLTRKYANKVINWDDYKGSHKVAEELLSKLK
jgi:tetratricopeptide (TPR) repeat protein